MNFIDLGLPSGTLWADENEEGFYTFDEAVEKYGDRLPSREQFEELRDKGHWERIDKGYKVTGPNGNTIVLHAKGFRDDNGNVYGRGSIGNYWTSTPYSWDDACGLCLYSNDMYMDYFGRYYGFSTRLVKCMNNKNRDNNGY